MIIYIYIWLGLSKKWVGNVGHKVSWRFRFCGWLLYLKIPAIDPLDQLELMAQWDGLLEVI